METRGEGRFFVKKMKINREKKGLGHDSLLQSKHFPAEKTNRGDGR